MLVSTVLPRAEGVRRIAPAVDSATTQLGIAHAIPDGLVQVAKRRLPNVTGTAVPTVALALMITGYR